MFQLVFEPQFKRDYTRVMRKHPRLKPELASALALLSESGELPDPYRPHCLSNSDATYTTYWEFHLSDGAVDVLVLYMPHKTNPIIRFVRMGSHEELFRGARP